jgi:CDP-glucose 4,6-dehydratase
MVTGSTGFLGGHLTGALNKAGHGVVGIERDDHVSPVGFSAQITARGDVTNLHFMERVLSDYQVECVIHLAAQTAVGTAMAEPVNTFKSNIEGTWTVLEACRRQKVKRVIVAATDKVYGWTPPPYKESDAVRATWPYETSKACADLLAQCYEKSYGMNVAVTRCGNFYGPGRTNWSTLIPGTIKSILEGKKPVLRSDGTFKRDFLFIDDAVSAYLALVASDVTGPFNFGTGEPSRVVDVVNLVCELMGWKDGITIIDEAKKEIVDQYLDCTKARDVLGWTATYNIREGLTRTIPWYVEHLKGAK